mgnify:CR=1 FL=1
MKILVYIQSAEGKINPISLESLVAAQQLKKEKSAQVHAVTFSSDIANKLSDYDIDSVIHVSHDSLNEYSPLHYIETFNQLNSELNPDLIIFGHTYETRDWVPRLSARLDIPFLSDCVGMNINDTITYTRSLYQNKINTDLSVSSKSAIISDKGVKNRSLSFSEIPLYKLSRLDALTLTAQSIPEVPPQPNQAT